MAVRNRAHRPDAERCHRCGHEAHEGRTQTIRRPAHAGSRLKLRDVLGRLRLKGQPSSRTGENSPYGMIGGIEETSASFEARSAPRSYPTATPRSRKRGQREGNSRRDLIAVSSVELLGPRGKRFKASAQPIERAKGP